MPTPLDRPERARRELASTVKRLRVSVTSDPGHGDELADALVRLTAARLLAWDFTEAAADAPEAVLLAARILARSGAAGPYTSPTDAARFFTASALLAAVQSGLGQDEAAARTLAGTDGWLPQLGRLQLREHLDATAVIWSLVARSRALLATDVPRANACADAAAHRLYAAGLDTAPGYLALTVHLLVADCRWAAGYPDQSLAHHAVALSGHRVAIGSAEPGRLRPALAAVAAAPVVALHEPYALRLDSTGEENFATAVRRAEVVLLENFGHAGGQLALARAGLARALAREGRGDEAQRELAEAEDLAAKAGIRLQALDGAVLPGVRCNWPKLTAAEALAPEGLPATAVTRLEQDVQAAVFDGVAARVSAHRSEERLRAQADAAATERAADSAVAERLARSEAAAAQSAAIEQDRHAAGLAAVRRESEEAAAREAADERRRQLAEDHQLVVDPAAARTAATELAAARDGIGGAADDLQYLRAAQERLASLLRPLAAVDPDTHLPELVNALEALVGLRWRLGDPEGSREAAREARALALDAGR